MALAAADGFRGTAAVCRSPPLTPQPPPGARGRTSVRIAAAANGQNFVHVRTPLFTFYSGDTATEAVPAVGPPHGGIELRVAGTNLHVFGERRDARCRFAQWRPLMPGAALGYEHVSAVVAMAAPMYKGESHMLCRTPPFPAGIVEVAISLNGRDFHTTQPSPLQHTYACEQMAVADPLDVVGCVNANPSCGHCRDRLSPLGHGHTAYGVVQDRVGCFACHADGCGRGPAACGLSRHACSCQ
jgi:hypothetical protein